MVRLYEYQGKQILKMHNIPIPEGYIVSKLDDFQEVIKKIGVGKSLAIKAQVLTTGRLKAGGMKFASTVDEAVSIASEMFGKIIKGMSVGKIVVEEKLDVDREFYVSITVSDSYKIKGSLLLFSTEGGVDIEEVAEKYPEKNIGYAYRLYQRY